MADYDFDIGILGAGAAGLTIAVGAAKAGARVLLLEKEHRLGGDCLYYGCVPSKTLIKTARVFHGMNDTARVGLDVKQPIPVTKEGIDRLKTAAREESHPRLRLEYRAHRTPSGSPSAAAMTRLAAINSRLRGIRVRSSWRTGTPFWRETPKSRRATPRTHS